MGSFQEAIIDALDAFTVAGMQLCSLRPAR